MFSLLSRYHNKYSLTLSIYSCDYWLEAFRFRSDLEGDVPTFMPTNLQKHPLVSCFLLVKITSKQKKLFHLKSCQMTINHMARYLSTKNVLFYKYFE